MKQVFINKSIKLVMISVITGPNRWTSMSGTFRFVHCFLSLTGLWIAGAGEGSKNSPKEWKSFSLAAPFLGSRGTLFCCRFMKQSVSHVKIQLISNVTRTDSGSFNFSHYLKRQPEKCTAPVSITVSALNWETTNSGLKGKSSMHKYYPGYLFSTGSVNVHSILQIFSR